MTEEKTGIVAVKKDTMGRVIAVLVLVSLVALVLVLRKNAEVLELVIKAA